MLSIADIIALSTDYLEAALVENPRRQAEELIGDVLGLTRMSLYLDPDRPLQEPELQRCRQVLQRRARGEPSQYIRGFVDFYGCRLQVDPRALIPRQETEILLDRLLQRIAQNSLDTVSVWDLCCGSGCLGIALKKRLPQLEVTLGDLCPQALSLARENARLNGVDVAFLQGDLFQPFEGKKAHIVLCNPPYISRADYATLPREVKDFEPRHALLSGETGLEFYQRFAREASAFLQPGALVVFEIGRDQGPGVQELFPASPWKTKTLEQDWAGHDRFFFLEKEGKFL